MLSDYAKGTLTDFLCAEVIKLARHHGKPVLVGPKGHEWQRYTNATLVSANRKETEIVTGIALEDDASIQKAGERLLEQLCLDTAVITLGPRGIYFIDKKTGGFHTKAEAQEVFDVTGAGDTVLAVISLCVAAGSSWRKAITMANIAAGIVVGKVGASTVTPELLKRKIDGGASHLEKIKSLEELIAFLEVERQRGRIIVLTRGDFDLLHPGHIRYLSYCKNQGDRLVIALDDGLSTKSPVLSLEMRAEILSALSFVDGVVISTDSQVKIIESIRPDVLIEKTSDETRKFVENYGGRIDTYPVEKEYSTQDLLSQIYKQKPSGQQSNT